MVARYAIEKVKGMLQKTSSVFFNENSLIRVAVVFWSIAH